MGYDIMICLLGIRIFFETLEIKRIAPENPLDLGSLRILLNYVLDRQEFFDKLNNDLNYGYIYSWRLSGGAVSIVKAL